MARIEKRISHQVPLLGLRHHRHHMRQQEFTSLKGDGSGKASYTGGHMSASLRKGLLELGYDVVVHWKQAAVMEGTKQSSHSL